MMVKRITTLILLVAIMVAGIAIPVEAVQTPDSKGEINAWVFRNLAAAGDACIVFEWDWDFSDNYTMEDPASSSIIYRLYGYGTGNTTVIQTGQPYVNPLFGTLGYGDNLGSFYISPDDEFEWGEEYTINIYGTPAFFDPAQSQSYTLTAGDYSTADAQADSRAALATRILNLADEFYAVYEIVLSTTSDSGIVLSSYGEMFFRGAIPGLDNLCPELFFIQVYVPEKMDVQPYDMSVGETYGERLTDTDMGRSIDALGEQLGMSGKAAISFVFLIIMIGLCIWTQRKDWGVEAGMVLSTLVLIFAALVIGDNMFTLMMIISLLAGIGIVYLTIAKRA